jgi:hypothetical protein
MSLEIMLSDLSPFQKRMDIIQQTAEQTLKDFDAFGYEILFSNEPNEAYQELFNQILPLIDQLITRNYKKLMAILYRIDVGEDLINKHITKSDPSQFAEIITELVLERELKKVIIRNYYKNAAN